MLFGPALISGIGKTIVFTPATASAFAETSPGCEGLFCVWVLYAVLRTDKEIRFRFWLSEDKAGKEAKRRTTGW